MKTAITVLSVFVVLITILLKQQGVGPHDEEALLTDWSIPPPFPIFIGINVIADTLRKIADTLTPPPVRMINMSFDYMNTALAYVCYKYDIAEFLSTGPKTIKEIAAFTKTEDTIKMERVMYAMASMDITQLDPTLTKGDESRFVNTALSATLRKSHPQYMGGMVGHQFEDVYPAAAKLAYAIGPNPSLPWDLVHPEEYHGPSGFWKLLEENSASEEQFGMAMVGVEGLGGGAMSLDGPFAKFDRLVDIGGSNGHFLYRNLKNYPDKKGVLFDRPPVIDNAQKHWTAKGGQYNDEETNNRVEMIKGDFFDADTLPECHDGDVLYLRYILHDWKKDDCIKILTNIRKAMKNKKATLVIGECAIPERDSVGLSTMHKIDIIMMNIFGDAMERTPTMWKELLNETGFDLVEIHPTRSLAHFVEAVPRSDE